MTNQSVLAKSQGFADSTEADEDLCPTNIVKVSNQDEEAESKLSSSQVANG
jgi:hypothetical protein